MRYLYFLAWSLLFAISACGQGPILEITLATGAESPLTIQEIESIKTILYDRLEVLELGHYDLDYQAENRDFVLEVPAHKFGDSLLPILTDNATIGFWHTEDTAAPSIKEALNKLDSTEWAQLELLGFSLTSNPLPSLDFNPELGRVSKWENIPALLALLQENFPTDIRLLPQSQLRHIYAGEQESPAIYLVKASSTTEHTAMLRGIDVTSAKVALSYTNEYVCEMEFNETATQLWESMTAMAATDRNQAIAITFNQSVISAPRVAAPISGGRTTISGLASYNSNAYFAAMLNSGHLPLELEIKSVRQID